MSFVPLPVLALAWLLLASLVAFVLCGVDKSRARHGATRIRERTLLLAALVGGTVGLVLGMLFFRHKTQKGSFLAKLGLVVGVQALALYFGLVAR